jgi:N-acetylglutamate synthase-like GNAT family acetyltransferase
MATHLAISVRRAQPSDAPALAELVNRAYEVERFFVEGERTSADEVARMLRGFLVLENQGSLAAAVYVESEQDSGYIGMLSVDPGLQGGGLAPGWCASPRPCARRWAPPRSG